MNQPTISKKHYDRMLTAINSLLINSGKTDLESQISAIESLNNNLIKTPLFLSIIQSLKELRAIKKQNKINN